MISKNEPNPLGLVFQPKAKSKTRINVPDPAVVAGSTAEPYPTWFAPRDGNDRPARKGRGKKSRKRKKPEVITTTTPVSTTTDYQVSCQAP